MTVDPRPVLTLEDCKLLEDLVYSTYGLTYHRSFMYDAERLLDLNLTGSLTSMIAVDRESGECVGHQATIRPWFEIADPLPPGTGAPVHEVGLSIVRPDFRGRGIQDVLALALRAYQLENNAQSVSNYMKCLTSAVPSQKSGRRFGGRATALFVAGVPAWVVIDAESKGPKQPLTTVLLHCPGRADPPRLEIPVPAAHAAFLETIYASVGLPRDLEPILVAAPATGETRVRTWFDPARRHGVVRLAEPGANVAATVLERVRWMVKGHIEHVTALLPLSGPAVAACVPELEAAGLFFGGVIPDLEGCDTLVMEWVQAPALDTDAIVVLGDEGAALKQYVLEQWVRTARFRQAS
ncbi:MAG: hypothetical protein GY898_00150 [Proteobacteria bacterium]|nr:hypothetical protein [Pseudomonadota bacterium]